MAAAMRFVRQSMACSITGSLRAGSQTLLRWRVRGVSQGRNTLSISTRHCATAVSAANHYRKKKTAKTDFVPNLTEDQEKMALDLLNNRSLHALSLTKGIGPEAAKLIHDYRKHNGPLASLSELKNIHGLKAVRFLKRVQDQEGNLFMSMKYNYVLLDLLTEEERKRFRNVVSIDISIDTLTAVNVGRNLEILGWKEIKLTRSKPYCSKKFADQIKDVFLSLPEADAYLVDKRVITTKVDPDSYFFKMQRSVVDMNVVEALFHAYGLKCDKMVLSIFPSEVNEYFGNRSGDKFVGAVDLLEQHLLERNSALPLESFADLDYLSGQSILKRVKFTDADYELYKSARLKCHKIAMADCLLQALYFLNYAVFMKRIV